jgi:hypothetical protein
VEKDKAITNWKHYATSVLRCTILGIHVFVYGNISQVYAHQDRYELFSTTSAYLLQSVNYRFNLHVIKAFSLILYVHVVRIPGAT